MEYKKNTEKTPDTVYKKWIDYMGDLFTPNIVHTFDLYFKVNLPEEVKYILLQLAKYDFLKKPHTREQEEAVIPILQFLLSSCERKMALKKEIEENRKDNPIA